MIKFTLLASGNVKVETPIKTRSFSPYGSDVVAKGDNVLVYNDLGSLISFDYADAVDSDEVALGSTANEVAIALMTNYFNYVAEEEPLLRAMPSFLQEQPKEPEQTIVPQEPEVVLKEQEKGYRVVTIEPVIEVKATERPAIQTVEKEKPFDFEIDLKMTKREKIMLIITLGVVASGLATLIYYLIH
jgi:hypothetical protein